MTRGWGEVAQVCRAEGALAIHFRYDDASMMFFMVFDTEGRRLECCPGQGHQDCPASSPSGGSGNTWESSDSPEPYETPRRATTAMCP